MRPSTLACVAAWVGSGCTATLAPQAPLGSVENPVRVDGRPGEIEYMGRLRCPSGGAPHFHIRYSAPVGPYGHKLDRFELRCVFDNSSKQIWIDRRHPNHRESRPVDGLDLVDSAAEVGPE